MKAKQIYLSILVVLAGGTTSAMASNQLAYSNDFDNASFVAPGVSAIFTQAGGGLDASVAPYNQSYGQYFRNNTAGMTTLTLSNLQAHDSIKLDFTLAFLESWDSRNGTVTPDNFDVWIDGNLVGQYTYNNASGTVKDIGGGTLVYEYTQFNSNSNHSDTVVSMGSDPVLSAFAHSASTLTIGFQASGAGWQGGSDEAWGIDNLQVSLHPVPVPSALLLFGSALLGLVGFGRRQAA